MRIALTVTFLFVMCCRLLASEYIHTDAEAIADIDTMYVLVEGFDSETSQYLSSANIQTFIELELRREDVFFVLDEDDESRYFNPYLYVNVTIFPLDDINIVYHVFLSMDRPLVRPSQDTFFPQIFAAVWDEGTTGVCPKDKASPIIKESLNNKLDILFNAYNSVNSQYNRRNIPNNYDMYDPALEP